MSDLREHLFDYLSLRRRLGFKLKAHEPQLMNFVAFVRRRRASHITASLALEWATGLPGRDPSWFSLRLSMVRGFAQHLRASDPAHETIPGNLLPFRPRRPAPYLYTPAEIDRLMRAARNLAPRPGNCLRPETYYCLLGLLATSGLRISEALALKRDDVDLIEGILTIRDTKFGKCRLVPMHPSTQSALARYAAQREADSEVPRLGPYFFVGDHGRPLLKGTVQSRFAKLCMEAGVHNARGPHRPRLHDFRHRHAVQTLINGYRAGQDTELLMPVLSTFLGHSHISSTYWYVTACPELMEHAASRLQAAWESQS